jgi:hypothetical protein
MFIKCFIVQKQWHEKKTANAGDNDYTGQQTAEFRTFNIIRRTLNGGRLVQTKKCHQYENTDINGASGPGTIFHIIINQARTENQQVDAKYYGGYINDGGIRKARIIAEKQVVHQAAHRGYDAGEQAG